MKMIEIGQEKDVDQILKLINKVYKNHHLKNRLHQLKRLISEKGYISFLFINPLGQQM